MFLETINFSNAGLVTLLVIIVLILLAIYLIRRV